MLTVAAHAQDPADCRELLTMLGLIEQPAPVAAAPEGPILDGVRHGYYGSYVEGCRCQPCRKAKTANWMAWQRRQRREPRAADRAGHGTYSTYNNYACRCAACCQAARLYRANAEARRQRAVR